MQFIDTLPRHGSLVDQRDDISYPQPGCRPGGADSDVLDDCPTRMRLDTQATAVRPQGQFKAVVGLQCQRAIGVIKDEVEATQYPVAEYAVTAAVPLLASDGVATGNCAQAVLAQGRPGLGIRRAEFQIAVPAAPFALSFTWSF